MTRRETEFYALDDPQWCVPDGPAPVEDAPLPMTRAEMRRRGWDACDIILVTGDAYVDHPSFGAALIGRFLESLGYRVGIIAQPNLDDVEAFRVLGPPRLCWGVTAGNVDSQLMRLTVMRKARRDDPYSPGGKGGRRPANATIAYTARVRQAYKGVPVVIGGVEASLRRFAYYDYWTEKVRRSVLPDSKADILAFGMAERAMAEIMYRLREGEPLAGIRGTAVMCADLDSVGEVAELPDFETVVEDSDAGREAFAKMARQIHDHTDSSARRALAQRHGDRWVVAYPPADALSAEELDELYDLSFTRRPHHSYRERIPAYDMIRDSITTHRGCYGGCTFCAIGTHQGTAVTSRTMNNVLQEVRRAAAVPGFGGTITDLGGPSANMYGTGCRRGRTRCHGRTCLHPDVCQHLRTDHDASIGLLRAARHVTGVKHVFVNSGVRFDLALHGGERYITELARYHTSGRLKIAPEHISPRVLQLMRKPPMMVYRAFVDEYQQQCDRAGKRQPVVEYFISGHPGCTLHDMAELAEYLHAARIEPEQVQDFYPVPMTLAAAMYYTGLDPVSGKAVYVARTDRDKALQRALLLHHDPDFQDKAREALREIKRYDLIGPGKKCIVPADARELALAPEKGRVRRAPMPRMAPAPPPPAPAPTPPKPSGRGPKPPPRPAKGGRRSGR